MNRCVVVTQEGVAELPITEIARRWQQGGLGPENRFRSGGDWRPLSELQVEIEAAIPLIPVSVPSSPTSPLDPHHTVVIHRTPQKTGPTTPILATIFYVIGLFIGFASGILAFSSFETGVAIVVMIAGIFEALVLIGVGQVIELIGKIEFNTRQK